MPPGAVVAFRAILAPDINVMTYLLTLDFLREKYTFKGKNDHFAFWSLLWGA